MATPDSDSRESFESISPPDGHKAAWQMEMDDYQQQSSPSFVSRLRRSLGMRTPWTKTSPHLYRPAATDEDAGPSTNGILKPIPRKTGYARLLHLLKRFIYKLPILILMFFGAVHIIIVLYGHKSWFWDILPKKPELPGWDGADKGLADYPTDVTRDTRPIPCHSHNDYWRRVPLFDALHWGCTSVEADVWYYDGNENLLVGHNSASLTSSRTLRSLYVDPLVELLDKMNPSNTYGSTKNAGVFDQEPSQTLVLLIDFKTDGHELFPHVEADLSPLRDKGYLSHWDGTDFISRPITIVGTGNAPFDLLTANQTYRDIFFDAPLDELYEPAPPSALTARGQGKTGTANLTPDSFNISNSYYASVSMWATIGIPVTGDITASHLEKIRGQIRGAKKRGLKSRYWETPAWPTSLKYRIWELLVKEGADVLNVDDLEAVTKLDWTEQLSHDWVDG